MSKEDVAKEKRKAVDKAMDLEIHPEDEKAPLRRAKKSKTMGVTQQLDMSNSLVNQLMEALAELLLISKSIMKDCGVDTSGDFTSGNWMYNWRERNAKAVLAQAQKFMNSVKEGKWNKKKS